MSFFSICVWEINEFYTIKLRKMNGYYHIQCVCVYIYIYIGFLFDNKVTF